MQIIPILFLTKISNKMKMILSFLAFVAIMGFTPVTAENPGSEEQTGIKFFQGTFEEAMKQAKKENKLVFVDVYATWCGPCKRLDAITFPDAAVGKYFNDRFINVKIDGEKGEGPTIRQRYEVRGYPTLLFLNHDGEVVHRTAGFRDPEKFLELGRSVPAKK
jgi:thioredoxin 1